MGMQLMKSGLISLLMAFAPSASVAQNNFELPSRIMNICVNGVTTTNNPSFVDSIGFNFKNSRYESDDLDQVDAIIYYKSDSLDITFQEYRGVVILLRMRIKCKGCVYDCEGRNVVSLGDSVNKVMKLNEAEFERYAKTYYPDVSNRKGIDDIPGMIIPFTFQFPRMPHPQAGQINLLFENKIVSELAILFYPD